MECVAQHFAHHSVFNNAKELLHHKVFSFIVRMIQLSLIPSCCLTLVFFPHTSSHKHAYSNQSQQPTNNQQELQAGTVGTSNFSDELVTPTQSSKNQSNQNSAHTNVTSKKVKHHALSKFQKQNKPRCRMEYHSYQFLFHEPQKQFSCLYF